MSSPNNFAAAERIDGPAAAREDSMLVLLTLGATLLDEMSVERVCSQITQFTKDALPGIYETSVTMLRSGCCWSTTAATGPLAIGLDQRQYTDGAGPCLHAATTGQFQYVSDMHTDIRWPAYAVMALQGQVLSSLSMPLSLGGDTVASLNIYALNIHAFDDHAQRLAEHIARYATAAIANIDCYTSARRLAEQMQQAMASRAVIEQAKGIIMGDRRCDGEEAFNLLSKVSQDANRKLRDVATALVEQAHPVDRPGRVVSGT